MLVKCEIMPGDVNRVKQIKLFFVLSEDDNAAAQLRSLVLKIYDYSTKSSPHSIFFRSCSYRSSIAIKKFFLFACRRFTGT